MNSVTETCHLITAPDQGDESCGTHPKIVKVQLVEVRRNLFPYFWSSPRRTKEGRLWVT